MLTLNDKIARLGIVIILSACLFCYFGGWDYLMSFKKMKYPEIIESAFADIHSRVLPDGESARQHAEWLERRNQPESEAEQEAYQEWPLHHDDTMSEEESKAHEERKVKRDIAIKQWDKWLETVAAAVEDALNDTLSIQTLCSGHDSERLDCPRITATGSGEYHAWVYKLGSLHEEMEVLVLGYLKEHDAFILEIPGNRHNGAGIDGGKKFFFPRSELIKFAGQEVVDRLLR